ncbi:hypothetical protein Taro_053656, partial [Colocasia esculenta]|nr:hypothetical protein [Colocasia esculenta]
VQHLIEKCLLLHLNKEECVEALSKHANIDPVITSTVWKELAKENKEFFESYAREMENRAFQEEIIRGIQKLLSDLSSTSPNSD